MKRVLATILAIIYFSASTGATVHMHYCMGKIYSVNLTKGEDDCNKCGMENSNNCCDYQMKTVKLDDSHNAVTNDINLAAPVAILDNAQGSILTNISLAAPSFATNNNSPPGWSGSSLYILHCIFRL